MAVGTVSTSILTDIANAIRFKAGVATTYKPRAVLTSLGTLELNYVDGRHCHDGGVPVNAWEIDPAGYSSATARPYDDIKLQVRKVVIHPSWPQVGMTNCLRAPAARAAGLWAHLR